MDIENLKYPIGRLKLPMLITDNHVADWVESIEKLPAQFRQVATNLSATQLETPYRPEGWTLRQVIHHVPDSHANAYIRIKWALTEDNPTIKAYDETAWAELPDSKLPIEPSLQLLESLHQKMVLLLKSVKEEELMRTFFHPELQRSIIVRNMLGLYAWHGQHHLAHLQLV